VPTDLLMKERPSSKRCGSCGQEKTLGHFHVQKNSPDGKQGRCKACSSERRLSYHYGLDAGVYARLKDAQDGACIVCRCADQKRLYVDHNHATGAVRGLICHGCNVGIGHMKDDPTMLVRAAEYLVRTGQAYPTKALISLIMSTNPHSE